MHLLEAGVEVNVIRGWLGHADLTTTNRYAEINTTSKDRGTPKHRAARYFGGIPPSPRLAVRRVAAQLALIALIVMWPWPAAPSRPPSSPPPAARRPHNASRAQNPDNGSAMVSSQLLRALAILGITLTHSKPGQPAGRGKIERFFRTVREQFLVELAVPGALAAVGDLVRLNELFAGWVETVYHHRVHSETGQRPLERFLAPGPPSLPTARCCTRRSCGRSVAG